MPRRMARRHQPRVLALARLHQPATFERPASKSWRNRWAAAVPHFEKSTSSRSWLRTEPRASETLKQSVGGRKRLAPHVGQTLSSVTPAISAILSQPPSKRRGNKCSNSRIGVLRHPPYATGFHNAGRPGKRSLNDWDVPRRGSPPDLDRAEIGWYFGPSSTIYQRSEPRGKNALVIRQSGE
jgi:hypothetical protein